MPVAKAMSAAEVRDVPSDDEKSQLAREYEQLGEQIDRVLRKIRRKKQSGDDGQAL